MRGSLTYCTGLGRLLQRSGEMWVKSGEFDRAEIAYRLASHLVSLNGAVPRWTVPEALADLDARRNLTTRALVRTLANTRPSTAATSPRGRRRSMAAGSPAHVRAVKRSDGREWCQRNRHTNDRTRGAAAQRTARCGRGSTYFRLGLAFRSSNKAFERRRKLMWRTWRRRCVGSQTLKGDQPSRSSMNWLHR